MGICGLPLHHAGEIEYRADVGRGLIEHELVQVFTARAMPDLVIAPNPDEVVDTDWINLPALAALVERFPERFTPWLRIYLRDHARMIFGQQAASLDLAHATSP
jgi:isopentenyl-diphosphate delta-isomerase